MLDSLFGRKAKQELAEVRSQFAGALVALIATQTALRRTSADYRAAVMLLHEKRLKIEELEARLAPKRASFSPTPLYLTEDEEDMEWAINTELMTADVAADILKELEFDNDDVFIDKVNDRSSLTY